MNYKSALLMTSATVLLASAPASATNFTFSSTNLPGGDFAGKTESITTTFNNNTELLTWSSTFSPNANGVNANGAWLVLSDGPNPKKHAGEYAIFYMDEAAEKVSIYEYDGNNNSLSWKTPGNFLGHTALQVSNVGNEKTFGFSLDMTDINGMNLGPDWEGAAFGDRVGIWLHGVNTTDVQFNADGSLAKFTHGKSSYYDIADKKTTAVPEPGSAAAVGLFAAAAAFIKRKQSA